MSVFVIFSPETWKFCYNDLDIYFKKTNSFNKEILCIGVHYKTGQKFTKTLIVHFGPLRLKSARIPLLEKCYWNFSCQTTF